VTAPVKSAASFRILSLDGGGIRGAFTAAVLATIESLTGKRIVEHFDLIAGTSTGGIIAIALGLGHSAQRILDFYVQRGPDIFPSTGVHQRLWRRLRRCVRPKHDAAALELALTEILGNRLLGESACRLLIPAFDAVAGDVHVFKTAHDPRVLEDFQRRAVDVARATSAAPTYLPMYLSSWGQRFLDGGIWANCPSTVAILEATGVLGIPLADIKLLSIGTTTPAYSVEKSAVGGGVVQYGFGASIIDLLLRAQAAAAWAQTTLLTAHRATRIDCTVKPGQFSLDDARALTSLVGHGKQRGRHLSAQIGKEFLDEAVVPFVPCSPAAAG